MDVGGSERLHFHIWTARLVEPRSALEDVSASVILPCSCCALKSQPAKIKDPKSAQRGILERYALVWYAACDSESQSGSR